MVFRAAISNPKPIESVEGKKTLAVRNIGATFAEAVNQAVIEGRIVIPAKTEAPQINFERKKMFSFESVSWEEDEEELQKKIHAFIARIEKIIKKGGETK